MAPSVTSLFLASAIFMVVLSLPYNATAGKYSAIFNFGDSLSDTGNALHLPGGGGAAGNPPFGNTYFHKPTGRCSDGRLILDFIAQALELPLVRPYVAGGTSQDFAAGANFAVVGTTALPVEYFRNRGLNATMTDHSLTVQMGWFKELISKSGRPINDVLSSALVMMGEIGGNDYFFMMTHGQSIADTEKIVPDVVNMIISSAESLINEGAKRLVVPGVTPMGCIPLILAVHDGIGIPGQPDPKTGCLTNLNDFSQFHNQALKAAVQQLQTKYPNVIVSYGDYYEGFMSIYNSPSDHGFKVTLAACCGSGGPYNTSIGCGDPKAQVCSDPSTYVGWDGIHYTEAAYNVVAGGLIHGPYCNPPILS